MNRMTPSPLGRINSTAFVGIACAVMKCGGGRDPRVASWHGRKAIVVTLRGMVDGAMARSEKRGFAAAPKSKACVIVLEIDTLGGELRAAIGIADCIRGSQAPRTVACANPQAVSAGAFIALACTDIVMGENSFLGDVSAADASSGVRLTSSKIDAFLRARLRSFCTGKYPLALVDALVTTDTEVYELDKAGGARASAWPARTPRSSSATPRVRASSGSPKMLQGCESVTARL